MCIRCYNRRGLLHQGHTFVMRRNGGILPFERRFQMGYPTPNHPIPLLQLLGPWLGAHLPADLVLYLIDHVPSVCGLCRVTRERAVCRQCGCVVDYCKTPIVAEDRDDDSDRNESADELPELAGPDAEEEVPGEEAEATAVPPAEGTVDGPATELVETPVGEPSEARIAVEVTEQTVEAAPTVVTPKRDRCRLKSVVECSPCGTVLCQSCLWRRRWALTRWNESNDVFEPRGIGLHFGETWGDLVTDEVEAVVRSTDTSPAFADFDEDTISGYMFGASRQCWVCSRPVCGSPRCTAACTKTGCRFTGYMDHRYICRRRKVVRIEKKKAVAAAPGDGDGSGEGDADADGVGAHGVGDDNDTDEYGAEDGCVQRCERCRQTFCGASHRLEQCAGGCRRRVCAGAWDACCPDGHYGAGAGADPVTVVCPDCRERRRAEARAHAAEARAREARAHQLLADDSIRNMRRLFAVAATAAGGRGGDEERDDDDEDDAATRASLRWLFGDGGEDDDADDAGGDAGGGEVGGEVGGEAGDAGTEPPEVDAPEGTGQTRAGPSTEAADDGEGAADDAGDGGVSGAGVDDDSERG
ncbi:hypothetical protein HK405_009078 [Cladochytrium tenue]|nr:hypothetical protein HK405_009078 [Cladochytrium tenue]